MVVSGLSNASFLGDLTNNGDIQTGTGSTAVFFGDVTGAGSFSGAGQVLVEGDLRPGNSAAAVSFGGDLVLAGALAVSVIDGFEASAGDSFEVFDASSLSGSFSSTSLPELSGSLSWKTTSLLSNGILQVIPEPTTGLLLALGLAGFAITRRARELPRAKR